MNSVIKVKKDDNGVSIHVSTLIEIRERNGKYLGHSPDLKTTGFAAESEELALENLKSAFDRFFGYIISKKKLDEVLIAYNWKKNETSYLGILNDIGRPKDARILEHNYQEHAG